MSEAVLSMPSAPPAAHTPIERGKAGMVAFLCTEAAFFSTLIVAYVIYMGRSGNGPTPRETLSLQLAVINSAFLITSSGSVALAHHAAARGRVGATRLWLFVTILLGLAFLVGTGTEWKTLIFRDNLTIRRNLFGTTYFTLLGFHAAHVTVGVVAMTLLGVLYRRIQSAARAALTTELISWYWHFVDVVWIAIFLIVYVIGRNT